MVLVCSAAFAGSVLDVRAAVGGPSFVDVGETARRSEPVVTWEGRPVDLVVVADLSVSVMLDPDGPGEETRRALEAALHALRADPNPDDRLGVVVFAGNAVPWIPLGPVDRPGLDDWLATFGTAHELPPPSAYVVPLRPGEWRPEPIRPERLALVADRTDPGAGLRAAQADLRPAGHDPLKVVVVIWDGGSTAQYPAAPILNRLWADEVHVYTIAVGQVDRTGLDARGGGDVFLSEGHADWAMERIVSQIRLPTVADR
jgi:hypothetical protein